MTMKNTDTVTAPPVDSSALLDGSLVSVYAKAKKQTKPLFSFRHPQLEKEMWKYQNDMTCTLLYGCSMKELPPDLRRTVERVLNARHRQHKKGENALLRVGSELSKRAKPSNDKLTP